MMRGILVVLLLVGCAPAGPYCEPDFLGTDMSFPACPEGMGMPVCVPAGAAMCNPTDVSLDVRCHGRDADPYCGVPGYELRCVPIDSCR